MFEKLFGRYMLDVDVQLEHFCNNCNEKKENCKITSNCLRNKRRKELFDKYNNSRLFGEEIVKDEDDLVDLEDLIFEDTEKRILALRDYYDPMNLFPADEMIDEESINYRGEFGRTALHIAVLNDDIEKINELLEEGADINVCDNNGHTPLVLAKLEGKTEAIKILEDFLPEKEIFST